MSAGWAIYYAMVAAHFVGGGHTLARGSTVHLLVLAVLLMGVGLQLIGCAALVASKHSIASTCVDMDFCLNVCMCFGLLALILRFKDKNWIIIVMLLQAASLAVDALVFDDDLAETRMYFSNVANLLNILEFATLAFSAAMTRRSVKNFTLNLHSLTADQSS